MKKNKYKCKNCGVKSSLITMGDLYIGCASCGSRKGFLEKIKGKWIDKEQKTPETDQLNKFLITGKLN